MSSEAVNDAREGGGSGAVTARPGQKHVTPKGRSRPIQEKVPVASASSQEEPSPDQVFVQGIALVWPTLAVPCDDTTNSPDHH